MEKEQMMEVYAKHCKALQEAVNTALQEVPAFYIQPVLVELAQGVTALAQQQLAGVLEDKAE